MSMAITNYWAWQAKSDMFLAISACNKYKQLIMNSGYTECIFALDVTLLEQGLSVGTLRAQSWTNNTWSDIASCLKVAVVIHEVVILQKASQIESDCAVKHTKCDFYDNTISLAPAALPDKYEIK